MADFGSVCLIAGRGGLPNQVVSVLQARGCNFKIIAIKGNTEGHDFIADRSIALDKWGAFHDAITEWQTESVVFAGKVDRPAVWNLRPDATLLRYLPRLGLGKLGDDAVMQRLLAIFAEEFNLNILSIQEILNQDTRPFGALGRYQPDAVCFDDIQRGVEILRLMSAADFGQSIAIAGGVVLGVEAIEGTDELIRRVEPYKQSSNTGVIVKMPKIQQDNRIDPPTIGVDTIQNLHQTGFAGIAISANDTIIVDEKAVIALADQLGVFIFTFHLRETV